MSVIRGGVILVASLLIAGCGGSSSSPDPADYRVEAFSGWPQDENHVRVDGYVESAWHDPENAKEIVFAIDSRAADETGSPTANAHLARIQTTKLPGYRERGVKTIRLGGRPAVRWAFDVSEEQSRIEFFFEECGISFVVRGSMGTVGYEALSESMREMASTIKANC